MLSFLIASIVEFSRRFAWAIVLLAVILVPVLGWFAVTHFKINTDINQLISSDLPWRQREADLEKAFPQKNDTLVIVIDGDTPDDAENAAEVLADKLKAMPDKFTMVDRPDFIPFFQKNGLLFLSKDELSGVLNQFVQAQPMLGTITSDPSLRGFFTTVGLMVQGIQAKQTDYHMVDQPFSKIADTVEAASNGQDKPLAMQSMMSGNQPKPSELRKFIMTKPVLDYSDLEPGRNAADAVRALVDEQHLTPDHGVHVRMTGSVALNDEEFASVANGTGVATALSGALVFVILLIALRSLRIIIPILLTLCAGLVATTAFALAFIGSLNPISVAFAVMFIGIAVDFGIQFGVRYRDQHHLEPDHAKAMTRTAHIIALPLSMAAGSTALGFLCFIPTDYRGVSELGLIAGAGMIIAFCLNITLLPALLAFTQPPAEEENIGYTWMAPVDAFLMKFRNAVLVVALVAALGATFIASHLRFDFDPLDLKDPHTESVSTLLDLMKDPSSGGYTIDILRPSLQDAQALAAQLEKLPQVDHVMTLASFVPEDQQAKLAMIGDMAQLLGPTLDLPATQAPPTDDDILAVMAKVAVGLHAISEGHPSADHLAKALDIVVAKHDHNMLLRLHKNIISAMQSKFVGVKNVMGPQPVTVDSITDDLKRDWVTPDGRYLVQVYPKGDPRNYHTLISFTDAVKAVAPDAGGSPISIRESGKTVVNAFIRAGIYAIVAIALLSFVVLRRAMDVLRLLTPLILAGILTLATMVLIDLPLNFANIIALPLLLSLGVSYAIYFVSYWRAGMNNPLQSSMARAVLFSAATVLVAFGSLALSSHPGTAGMGKLLTLALVYSVICTFAVLPALLGRSKTDR